jgi:putative redox protein
MDVTVTWKAEMAFSGVGAGTNFPIPIGSKPTPEEPAQGASPMELILMGLAGCTGMDVISILKKKRQDVTAFEIRVHADRGEEYPRPFTYARLEYVVTGHHVDPDAVSRAVELSLEKYCGAHATLRKAMPIEHIVTIVEADSVAA